MARDDDNWFRKLQDNRLEVSLKAGGVKVRGSGPEDAMFDLVFWFEVATGKQVNSPNWKRPLRTGPRPLPGQAAFEDAGEPPVTISELSSDDTVAAHA